MIIFTIVMTVIMMFSIGYLFNGMPAGRFTAISGTLLIALGSIGTYAYLGRSIDLPAYWEKQAQQQQVKTIIQQLKTPQAVIEKLKQRIKQTPEDAKGWYLLGRLYFVSRQFENAVAAFSKANELHGDDTHTMVQLAQALYLKNNMRLTPQASLLIKQVLQQDSANVLALNLLATNAYQQQHYQQAQQYWRRLKAIVPANSDDARTLNQALQVVNMKLHTTKRQTTVEASRKNKLTSDLQATAANGSVASSGQAGQSTAQTNSISKQYSRGAKGAKGVKATLVIHLDISSELKQTLAADTVVFIYAKAHQGPAMPLAVIRKTIADLPTTVVLNDAHRMRADLTLSAYDSVDVFAKISLSGQAFARANDRVLSKLAQPNHGEIYFTFSA